MRRWGLFLLVLVTAVSAGDPDVAAFLTGKGNKALRAKDYAGAEKDFRRALKEMDPYPEASYGLGQALEKQGRAGEAVAAYQKCFDDIGGMAEPPRKLKSLKSKAAKAISRLRRRFAELDRVHRDFIKKAVAFARANMQSNPAWARKAFETVLLVDPTHGEAKRALEKLPKTGTSGPPVDAPKPSTSSKSWGTPLVRDSGLDGWSPGLTSEWTCRGKVITGDATGHDGKLNWLDDKELTGNYEIRVKLRLLRDGGGRRAYGVFLGGDGKKRWWSVIFGQAGEVVLDRFDGGRPETLKTKILAGEFDPKAWHTLRIVSRRGDLTVFVDDVQAYIHSADDRGAFDGKICLFVQSGRVAFKDLEWKKR